MGDMRHEEDALGTVEVPADRYWGAQTSRSIDNFPIGDERIPAELVHALGVVKQAAARANAGLGRLDPEVAGWIVAAAAEVAAGALDDHFPLVVWQTGSGTQTHMNANEVIANRAIALAGGVLGSKDPVHPNDHVNLGQSSNDVFPTAMHIASVSRITGTALPGLEALRDALHHKAVAWQHIVKIGRTHLQDATPLTLGQALSGMVAQLDAGIAEVRACLDGLRQLALGGTAVGTGLNTHPDFAEAAAAQIAALTGEPFCTAPNKFAALAGHDAMVRAHHALEQVATALHRIANDLRWLASGPRCGIGELELPANEPGSSIMPGKVNPTQAEALTMVCARVLGNGATVRFAASLGNFELNVYKPVIAHAVLQSARLIGDASRSFALRCVEGMAPRERAIQRHLDASLMLVTALTPHIGYDAAARVAKHAHAEDLTLREACAALGVLSTDDFDRLVDPADMVRPKA